MPESVDHGLVVLANFFGADHIGPSEHETECSLVFSGA